MKQLILLFNLAQRDNNESEIHVLVQNKKLNVLDGFSLELRVSQWSS